jgi:hypothetical protein
LAKAELLTAESEAEAAKDAAAKDAAEAEPVKKASRPSAKKELWLELADEILSSTEPRVALSAALFEAFGAEIDPARYRKIEGYSVDAAATARLFIGSGKRDKATPAGLASLVKRLSGLPDRSIGGIEIYENFSFVTVPFEAAEKVLSEARRSGSAPTVRFATPKGGGASRSGPPRGPAGPRSNARGAPYGDRPPRPIFGAAGGFPPRSDHRPRKAGDAESAKKRKKPE